MSHRFSLIIHFPLVSFYKVHYVGKVFATSDPVGRVLEYEQFATDADYKRTLTRVINCVLTMIGKNRRQIDGLGVSLVLARKFAFILGA